MSSLTSEMVYQVEFEDQGLHIKQELSGYNFGAIVKQINDKWPGCSGLNIQFVRRK